ncbi:MAG: DUF92 domain-containing protein [Candidatus Diapherotrites archaeon]
MTMAYALEIAVLVLTLAFFSIAAYKKKALDFKGVIAGNVVGIIVFFQGGIADFLVLVALFSMAVIATEFSRRKVSVKHEKRTTSNILGNSGAALIAVFFLNPIAFFGAASTALADTLSSEIGLLSKTKPKLITSFREVEHGTNGGVTVLGTQASLVGAAVIAVLFLFFQGSATGALIVFAAGMIGSFADSVLGATIEEKGILSNAGVNFFACLLGALIAFSLNSVLL